jgi:SAM-dependent methyltransferase
MTQEDRQKILSHYDQYGETEWERLEKDINGRVSLEVHRQFLNRFISHGDRVLEIGAGPGRFTQELIDLGARVAVTDFSPVQLELNRMRLPWNRGKFSTCATQLDMQMANSMQSWPMEDPCPTHSKALIKP